MLCSKLLHIQQVRVDFHIPSSTRTDLYKTVQPVALYTPIHLGGFQFSPKQISLALALAGASQAFWMIGAFPYLQRKTSTGSVLRGCCIAWPIEMACYPIANELLRADFRAAFWTLGAVCVFFGSGIAMSFACVQLCLNDVAPSPSTLATLNAVALTVTSGLRALGPVGMASLYAVGVKGGWLHGHLGWLCLVFMGVLLNVSVRWLPASAEGDIRGAAKVDDEEEWG
jgi:hypothetical protein